MSRDYRLFIKDIIESIDQIEKFTLYISFNDFVADDMISSAVIRKLEIIGEASKNMPENTRMKYNNLPCDVGAKHSLSTSMNNEKPFISERFAPTCKIHLLTNKQVII